MALNIEYTPEQRKAQGEILASIFRLPNADNIREDWSMEQVGKEDILLRVELIARITPQQAEQILNAKRGGTDD